MTNKLSKIIITSVAVVGLTACSTGGWISSGMEKTSNGFSKVANGFSAKEYHSTEMAGNKTKTGMVKKSEMISKEKKIIIKKPEAGKTVTETMKVTETKPSLVVKKGEVPKNMEQKEVKAMIANNVATTEDRSKFAVVRFDRENVDYQQPIAMGVKKIHEVKKDAEFLIISYVPNTLNEADKSAAGLKAVTNMDDIERVLINSGVPEGLIIKETTMGTPEMVNNEVHVFVK